MSPSITMIACAFAIGLIAMALGVRADGGQIVEEATGTKFERRTQIDGTAYECLGTGVRKIAIAKVYALAFYVDAAHANPIVESYLQARHSGLRGEPLFEALLRDQQFFDTLAGTAHGRLIILKMLRNVSRKQLADTIRRSLTPLLPQDKLDRLDAAITKGAEKGQVVKIYAVGSKLTVDVAGEVRTIEDEQVARHLYFVWLGAESVSPTLREDIARRAARVGR